MENPTSFDLNGAVQRWRDNLAQSPSFRSENLDELEAHLRDSIATVQGRGLSVEEAFLIATRRIGKGGLLEIEFGKVNRRTVWMDRALWMLIGIQVWKLGASVTGSVVRNAFTLGVQKTNYTYKDGLALPVSLYMIAQALVTAVSLGLCWWLLVRKGQRVRNWLEALVMRPAALVSACAKLYLLSLVLYALSYGIQVFLIRSHLVGLNAMGETALYSTYSQFITQPILIAAMIILTAVLARKRLRVSTT